MGNKRGLTSRLGRELLLQAVYISAAVLVGVFIAANLIPEFIIKQALQDEAAYYWSQSRRDSGHALPDTKNMTAYREGFEGGVPAWLAGLPPGYHRQNAPRETLVFISEQEGQRLYLVFEVEQVNELIVLFGLIPLALALTVIYLSLYSGYRVSRRAVSPVVNLAQRVQRLDPAEPDASLFDLEQPLEADAEILVLSDALRDLVRRVTEFSERERRFTRDTSHELRTPLTVIKMAVDKLLKEHSPDESSVQTLLRIRKSADDMEHLTAAFLLLAREADQGLEQEWVCVNDIVAAEFERARIIDPDSQIRTSFTEDCKLSVHANEKVVASVIGNLLRNALSYTDDGSVSVHIKPDSVAIQDTGPGMDPGQIEQAFKPYYRGGRQRGGFGVGLTIVKRLTERFNWPLDVESEPDSGTRATLRFPDARAAPLSGCD
ncbi:MAG: HAMP domain-containing sensor histidine kinase [Xanthomonadales bacterium]|nr:HAMP domain-containing sensor histidine kinase [Xanthomonadales bacterium]